MRSAVCIAAALIGAAAHAQSDWPSKPVRIAIGTPAGGGSDLMARLVAKIGRAHV